MPDYAGTMFPPWVTPFLAELRRSGVAARAARAAGVSYSTAYALRDSSADFKAAWDDALEEAVDDMEAEARERAMVGHPEPLTHQGTITYEFERDEHGRVVTEQVDTGTVDKDGKTIFQTVPKLKLDEHGRPVPVVVHKRSDTLLMFLLKGRRKKVFAERTEVTGPEGGAVQLDDTARAARVAALMAMARQRKLAEDFKDLA